jgi:hypothetical protein
MSNLVVRGCARYTASSQVMMESDVRIAADRSRMEQMYDRALPLRLSFALPM